MTLLLNIAMVALISWGLYSYAAARGGLPWFWAILSASGYVILEFSACYAFDEKPSEYFFTAFPMAGLLWMILVSVAARIRFRGRAVRLT